MILITLTQTKQPLLDELLPLVKQHLRITSAMQDVILTQYINASVEAAANFLGRDVWPTERAYTGPLEVANNVRSPYLPYPWTSGYAFDFRYGRASAITFKLDDVAVVPTWVEGNDSPKAPGFRAFFSDAQTGTMGLTLKSGYENLAAMPGDLVQFIITSVAMMNEVREMGNYSQVFPVEAYPIGLLQSWATPTLA